MGLDFDAPRFPNWPDAPPAAPRAFTPTQLLTPASFVGTPPPPRREIDEPPTPYRPEPAAEAYAAPPPLPSLPTEEGYDDHLGLCPTTKRASLSLVKHGSRNGFLPLAR